MRPSESPTQGSEGEALLHVLSGNRKGSNR